ncbi:hypothetical protein [Synechococcus sp. RSCCF101]|uniref:hypothetical protein n=1 Tax=Synechococcus sp. RSCCF101 TaxID=2511069 RepID=UPI001781FFFA|nr:hypothetical protein [Synechococcus sp. RSCCF101]
MAVPRPTSRIALVRFLEQQGQRVPPQLRRAAELERAQREREGLPIPDAADLSL